MVEDNKNNNDIKEELNSSKKGENINKEENESLNEKDKNMETSQNDIIENKIEDKIEESTPNSENETKLEEKDKKEDDATINQENTKELKSEGTDSKEEIKKEETLKKDDISEENDDAKWYVVGAHSGFEEKAAKTIFENAKKSSLSHFFFDSQIPKREIVEIRKGKKINTEKNFFPGYMLIKMVMNNQTWQLVKKSNKVSGFVGNDHNPIPLTENEAMKMLKKGDDNVEYIAPKLTYEVGEQVKIAEGPFASFNGMVEEVDEERGKLKISVSIFGRSTPVELEYTQVEKM